jgi:molecular chaperone GrpE
MTEANDPQRHQGVDEFAETQVLDADQQAPAGELGALREALARAQAAEAEQRDQVIRIAAEMDNLRKRSAREVDNARRFGPERLAGDLLAVVDSLEMGLEAARGAGATGALLEGQEATLKLLLGALEKAGVSPVQAEGERFNPEFHEAMGMIPAPDSEPGAVVAVVQKGYLLHGRLLRPARVMVAAEPPAGQ